MLARGAGVESAILVQSQESERDTRWLLAVAKGSSFVAGVVGWADLSAADIGERLDGLVQAGPLVGIVRWPRDWPMTGSTRLQSRRARGAGRARPRLRRIDPPASRLARSLAARHPALPIMIDHGAKPSIVPISAGLA